MPGSRSDFLARDAQTGPRMTSGRCLPGRLGRDPRTMLPGGRGPGRAGVSLASGFREALGQAVRWHEKSAFDLEG